MTYIDNDKGILVQATPLDTTRIIDKTNDVSQFTILYFDFSGASSVSSTKVTDALLYNRDFAILVLEQKKIGLVKIDFRRLAKKEAYKETDFISIINEGNKVIRLAGLKDKVTNPKFSFVTLERDSNRKYYLRGYSIDVNS